MGDHGLYDCRGNLVPTVGWLGSRFGNRTSFLVSLGAFVVSSGLCGLAWNGPSLVIFRVLQGLGEALLPL